MWRKITEFLTQDSVSHQQVSQGDELKIAIAALLVTTAHADEHAHEEEHIALHRILTEHFHLNDEDTRTLIEQAEQQSADAIDLHRFVHVVNRDLDNEERKDIIKHAWRIVLADGVIDNIEDNLMRKLGSLMGIGRKESVFLRHEVEAENVSEK